MLTRKQKAKKMSRKWVSQKTGQLPEVGSNNCIGECMEWNVENLSYDQTLMALAITLNQNTVYLSKIVQTMRTGFESQNSLRGCELESAYWAGAIKTYGELGYLDFAKQLRTAMEKIEDEIYPKFEVKK